MQANFSTFNSVAWTSTIGGVTVNGLKELKSVMWIFIWELKTIPKPTINKRTKVTAHKQMINYANLIVAPRELIGFSFLLPGLQSQISNSPLIRNFNFFIFEAISSSKKSKSSHILRTYIFSSNHKWAIQNRISKNWTANIAARRIQGNLMIK